MTYYRTLYETSQGERWYDIAWAFYHNPSLTAPLVEANPSLLTGCFLRLACN